MVEVYCVETDPQRGSLDFLGFVHVDDQTYKIRLRHHIGDSYQIMDTNEAFKELFRGHEKLLEQRLQTLASETNVEQVMMELNELSYRLAAGRTGATYKRNSEFYELLYHQLSQVGWKNVVALNEEDGLQDFNLLINHHGRAHEICVELAENFPDRACCCRSDLPSEDAVVWWHPRRQTLPELVQHYKGRLDYYNGVWSILEVIDASLVVLDNKSNCRSDFARRIALGFLHLKLNPAQPEALPELIVIGPDKLCIPLRQHIEEMKDQWFQWSEMSFVEKLECILGVSIPKVAERDQLKRDQTCLVSAVQCGICYTDEMESEYPAVSCNQCSQLFHKGCLVEWCNNLLTTRQTFNKLYGTCPYCEHAIIVVV